MHSQPAPVQRRNRPQAASKQGRQGIASLHLPWYHSWKLDHLLLLTSAVQFALFAPLAWWARKHPRPLIEVAFTRVLQKKQPSPMRRGVQVFNTLTGSAVFLNVLVVPAAIVFWKRHLRLEALMTLGISWTNVLARTLIKRLVDRPRPHPVLVHRTMGSFGKSFPSGHVASALTFWGWLFALGMLIGKESRAWQQGLLSLPVLFVILVGPARIYLGDHWSTDVLGGYLFGGGWLGLSLWVYRKLRNKGVLARG